MTPPILREPGSLIDCLNYEISDTMGYRRCDGYERYDGFSDGGTLSYYVLQVTGATTPTLSETITGATLEDPSKLSPNRVLGVVVELGAVVGALKTITVALYTDFNRFPVGYALKIGANNYTVTEVPVPLKDTYTAATAGAYYAKVRSLMAYLRALVKQSDAAVAGLHYAGTQLYKAVDNLVFLTAGSFSAISSGQRFSYNGKLYKAMYVTTNRMEAFVVDPGPYAPNLYVQPQDQSGADVGPPIFLSSFFFVPALTAHMVFVNNPDADNYLFGVIGNRRGDVPLVPSFSATFNDGSNSSVTPNDMTGALYDSGGFVKVGTITISNTHVSSGSFATNDAAGVGSFSFSTMNSPAYPVIGDTVRTAAGVILYTIDSVSVASIPGTGALKGNNTHYVWGSYQFLATVSPSSAHSYGTTGCSRGVWLKRDSYGNIFTQMNAALDIPKYVTMHCRAQLALGFKAGSVQLSVPGKPLNFNGVEGASETGMGDTITGLLESQGTSTIVLCRGSIARLSGVGASLQQETISGKVGAFDYTGANVGGTPVFTNQNGVTTLEQSAAYGDFVGERATSPVGTRLIPKLIDDSASFEVGGVVCAFPVRTKDQYRLVLKNGDVYSVAFTSDGPKIMISNLAAQYDTTEVLYIPMAWSSEVDAFGKEQLHVAFDRTAADAYGSGDLAIYYPDQTITYKMDYGWGYDGKTFLAYFDVANIFAGGGLTNSSVEKVRMYGMGYGLATLDVKTSGVEDDFDQDYHTTVQDISMPINYVLPYKELSPVTSIVDQANWGLGIKVRINNTNGANSESIEPPHICQVLQLHTFNQGAIDS